MRNKQRFLKLIAVLAVAVFMVLSLASCAMGGSSAASDANGEHGSLKWDYKKDGQTLTITGSGAMTAFTGTEDIAWSSVASSVKKVVVGAGITSVGDYAFFGMSSLSEVQLPDGLVSIGKLSFAYTPALEGITLPESLTTIGYGAFETSGIKAIALPANVKTISDRTFMYCDELETVTGSGVESIGKEAFAYCRALEGLRLPEGFDKTKIGENAFTEASANADNITVADNKITITYMFLDAADGKTVIKNANGERREANSEGYLYYPPEIEGYAAVHKEIHVTVGNVDKTVNVLYTKVEQETEADTSVDTGDANTAPKDEKLDPMTIVALVVMVIVIIAIIVGTLLFMRHDKKNSGSRTVRKDKDEKKDKKNKN